MVNNWSATARNALATNATAETRIYIDPRMVEYAPIGGTETYSANAATDPAHGEYCLAQSSVYTCYPFTYPITFEWYGKPNWAYDVASSQVFCNFYADGYDSASVAFYYSATDDKLGARIYQNIAGGGVTAASALFPTVYTSNEQIQQWIRLTAVVEADGITVYINGADPVTAAFDMTTLRNLVLFRPGGNDINCYTNYVKIIPAFAASAAHVATNFQGVHYEQAWFGFQQTAVGRTRCDVSRGAVTCKAFSYQAEDGYKAATARADLVCYSGELCSDQYATYAPESGSYNGTSSEKYLSGAVGLTIEQPLAVRAATDPPFDILFHGVCEPGSFSRSTSAKGLTMTSLHASDFIKVMSRRRVKSARSWANYYLSRATPSNNSVWHELAYLAAKKDIYNYVGNSGFENTTVGNSWLVSGTGAAIARSSTRPLLGTYSGNLTGTSGPLSLYQDISDATYEPVFDDGMTLTFQAFIYAAAGASITFRIQEYNGVTAGSTTAGTTTHAKTGWMMYYISHLLADATRTKVRITYTTDSLDSSIDCAMLTQGGAKQYYIENSADGVSGVVDSYDEQLGQYLQIGCVAEDVDYQHTWPYINRDDKPFERLCDCADACLAWDMNITPGGVLHMWSAFDSAEESVSRGTIPKASNLSQTTQKQTANKISVEGCYIVVKKSLSCLWEAKSMMAENENAEGDEFYYGIANGDFFPDLLVSPSGLECLYNTGG